MSPVSRPILVVSYVEATLNLLVSNLSQLNIPATPCVSFCDAEKLALEETFSGILIDLASIIKAKGEEKVVAYTLASVFPTLRVRAMGSMLIPMAMPGDAKQDSSLKEFITRTCAGFTPRTLRMYRRREKCVSTVRTDIPDGERGFTLNISWGGAFIVTTNPECYQAGQEQTLLFHEFNLQVKVRICWVQPWGHRQFSGYGVCFTEMNDELSQVLFQLLKYDRSIDRDRVSG